MDAIIRYFDLLSDVRPRGPAAKAAKDRTDFHWLPQYLALLAGTVLQPYAQLYMQTGNWQLHGFWGWLAISLVIAVMAFPGVYKQSFDPKKPLFVQCAVIFTTGMGWQALVGTALKGLQRV